MSKLPDEDRLTAPPLGPHSTMRHPVQDASVNSLTPAESPLPSLPYGPSPVSPLPGGTRRTRGFIKSTGPALLALVVLIAAWELVGAFSKLLPPPTDTVQSAWHLLQSGQFFGDMASSLRRVFVSFIAAMAMSVVIGIIMGTSRFAERFFEPLVILGLTIPGLIWALVVIMVLGIGEISDYFAVFTTILPMLVVNIWAGVKSLDKELVDMAHVIGLGSAAKVIHIILPQLVPHILAAARYGLGLAWKVVVVVELFGATSGVGYQINNNYQKFDLSGVLAWTLLFVIVMLILEKAIIGLIERRLTAWQPRANVWRR